MIRKTTNRSFEIEEAMSRNMSRVCFQLAIAGIASLWLGTISLGQSRPLPDGYVLPSMFANGPQHLPKKDQQAAASKPFQCSSPVMLVPGNEHSKHSVVLSWKPSVSLSSPLASGEGYNVYRRNPDGSCTKLNAEPIRATVYEDDSVKLGQSYRYVVKAVRHNAESSPSEVIDVTIPSK